MNHRSFFSSRLLSFLDMSDDEVIGAVTLNHGLAVVAEQTRAWKAQCEILRSSISSLVNEADSVFFEFSIPRMGKRADVVLVIQGIVFVVEFKVGSTDFHSADRRQALDYALDLKNFHSGSHDALIIPILVASEARASSAINLHLIRSQDGVSDLITTGGQCFGEVIQGCLAAIGASGVGSEVQLIEDGMEWALLPYKPTPTIVQAAQALYQGHDVKEISRSDAGARNLTLTASEIAEVVEHSKRTRTKSICFVTGVPGAGKTLAGLNIATQRMNAHQDEHAVFLSGNGPLVTVLREALARDEGTRLGIPIGEARRKAETFIQNIHHFRDDNLISREPPVEKVVVFDEAQRAWDRDHTSKFMRTKKGQPHFDQSEPEFLIEVMDRHSDWCVIIALIGGGQEINTGEAGLAEWFASIQRRFQHWNVYYSERLKYSAYFNGVGLTRETEGLSAFERTDLHLAVSVRSFRAEKVSDFVEALLDLKIERARELYRDVSDTYPIFVTRSIDAARAWLRERSRGSELSGILASSGGLRLRPDGLHVKAKIDPANWFLNGCDDVRSCQYLEEVATEFDVQGLELDWTCIGWDANLRCEGWGSDFSSWSHNRFIGTKWQKIKQKQKQEYLRNSYRVLLTRARQGMVIFVPEGDSNDPTRSPDFYDGTFAYLKACGIGELLDD